MKKLIQNFLSQKKYSIPAGIIVVVAMALGIYTIKGIQKNVKLMEASAGESPIYFPEYPKAKTTPQTIEQIRRGEYLVKAGDCIACHTNAPEKGTSFAGGLPMQTPFGTIYSPNITPDKKTGIGNWTDEQFIRAMREGISPTGQRYYPAFPYLYFNKVSTEDLLAIKAYLDHIPPVEQQNRKNELIFPFNWRFLQSGWRILFFNPVKTGPYKNDPKKSAEWNRGAYLVEGLGHCAMCHTPSYYIFSKKLPLGAPMQKYNLTGAPIQGYLAPNITKMNLGAVDTAELIRVFTHDQMVGGGKIDGPMLEANHDSLVYLTHSDLSAIAVYLKSVESKTPPRPKAGKGGMGKFIYDNYCSGCHATGAGGAPKYGDTLTWEPVIKKGKEKIYNNAIRGIGGMPAKGTCATCSETDIQQAVDYMMASVTGPGGKLRVTPVVKKLSLADGKRIYQENCSVCHETGFKEAPKPGDMTAWKPIVDAGFVQAYENVAQGKNSHPIRGACATCSDAELKAAVKYMLQSSTTTKDFSLW